MIDKIVDKWNEGEEGIVTVLLFTFLVVFSAVAVFGLAMPFLISAKSTVAFIFGVLLPFIYASVVFGIYRIFFVMKD